MTELGYEEVGNGSRRLVLLHGFTQTRAIWRDAARRIVEILPDSHCLLVDLPGHGDSQGVPTDSKTTTSCVASLGGNATYVGYSLGARIALRTAFDHPNHVQRLIMVSGTAGIEDAVERDRRARADDVLAERIERIGVEAFLDEWLTQPIFRDLPTRLSARADRAANSASGLAASLRGFGQGRQDPLWSWIPRLHTPLLAIAGSRDDKYAAIARRLAVLAPRGEFKIIEDSGHSVVLEQPVRLADEIGYWMATPNE